MSTVTQAAIRRVLSASRATREPVPLAEGLSVRAEPVSRWGCGWTLGGFRRYQLLADGVVLGSWLSTRDAVRGIAARLRERRAE